MFRKLGLRQVWTLTQFFFCFLFVKTHWFAWRANQWPLIGETLFSSVPPSNSLVSVSDPRRAFWADTVPFLGPRLASCVASGITELQRHRQVCSARRGGPRTLSTTTDANLDCAVVENALFYTDPWPREVNRIELSSWPDLVGRTARGSGSCHLQHDQRSDLKVTQDKKIKGLFCVKNGAANVCVNIVMWSEKAWIPNIKWIAFEVQKTREKWPSNLR